MFVFQKIWCALFSCNTRFVIRPFAWLPTNKGSSICTYSNYSKKKKKKKFVLWYAQLRVCIKLLEIFVLRKFGFNCCNEFLTKVWPSLKVTAPNSFLIPAFSFSLYPLYFGGSLIKVTTLFIWSVGKSQLPSSWSLEYFCWRPIAV